MILIHGYIHRLLHMFRRLLIESAQGFGEEPPGRFAALAGQHLRTTRLAPLRICRVVSREGAFHAEDEVKLMCVCVSALIYIYTYVYVYIYYILYMVCTMDMATYGHRQLSHSQSVESSRYGPQVDQKIHLHQCHQPAR